MKKLLSTKLIKTHFILILCIIVFAAIILSIYNTNMLKSNAMYNLEQFCEDTTDQVDTTLHMMETTAIEIAINKDLLLALQSPSLDTPENTHIIRSILNQNYINKFNIYRISVFTKNGYSVSTNAIDISREEIKNIINNSEWYNNVSVENGRKFLVKPHKDPWSLSYPIKVISLVKAIKDGNEILGYIEIQQNVNVLENICKNQWNGNNLCMALIDRELDVFYTNLDMSSDKEHYNKVLDTIVTSLQSYSYKTFETSKDILSINDSNNTELKVVLLLPKQLLLQSNKYFQLTLLLVLFIVTILSYIAILIMTKTITNPINKLVKKISLIDINNLSDFTESNSGSYEADLINHTFNEMANRLKSSLNKEITAQKLQTKAAFDILQSQIGPHFLYNTLGSIANMCEEGENKSAADACYNLSEILRYAGNYTDCIVPLKSEIENMEAYMALMKYRYKHRINYSINYDVDILSINLPKLTLQPIVENAIKYSLIHNENVYIDIYCGLIDSLLYIKISDNGIGIDEETKQIIYDNFSYYTTIKDGFDILQNIKFGGMGLLGTILRLYLHFGDKSSYDIIKNKTGGTTLILFVDIKERREFNVQSYYSRR